MTPSVETLQKKIKQSQLMHDQLEKTYQAQFDALNHLIGRLSLACKGIDTELDNKLAKLRKLLSKNVDLENIEPLLNDINKLLLQHGKRVEVQMSHTQTSILIAGKNLQQIKGLPNQLRRDLRALLEEVGTDNESIIDYIPQLNSLVEFYNQTLNVLKDKPEPQQGLLNQTPKTPHSNTSNNELLPKTHDDNGANIASEIINLLDSINFESDLTDKVSLLKGKLTEKIDTAPLLGLSVKAIKLIILSINKERKSAQNFLLTLNDALQTVHNAVTNSLDNTRKISENKHTVNQRIKTNLNEMGMALDSATTLDMLKDQVAERIGDIAEAIAEKEALEQQEHLALSDDLKAMEVKLIEIEKQAQSYKNKSAEQKVKSLQDSLTKLPNRAAFDERLEQEYNHWLHTGETLCIAVIDIDLFKNVNDTFGHSAGDKTLQVISLTLRKNIRSADFISRYGGEEFVILFPKSNLDAIETKLNRIREQVKKIPFKFKNQNLFCTISAGVTLFKQGDAPRTAFDRADEALYEAKRNGRNKVVAHL